jgi:Kef-type K+ transport system membrane component KefB
MLKTATLYGAALIAAVIVFLFIVDYGQSLSAPPAAAAGAAAPHAGAAPHVLFHLLLALATVVAVGRLLGRLFVYIGQPPVIGEVVGGILLGPSLLGQVSPAAYEYILPQSVAPYLGIVAQLGVILYMFVVGLELNPELLRSRIHAIVAISHASIVAPFLLGAALAVYLYPRFATSDVPFTSFSLFLGLAMSITAFPVLARILQDCGLTRTHLGTIALTCAAVGDVTAWCLLAFVVGVVNASTGGAILAAALTIGFIAVMFGVVRPLAAKALFSKDRQPTQGTIAAALVSVLLAALTTDAIGIHAIFGAFLFGAVIPHESKLAHTLRESLGNLVTILLLPAFFAFTGMRTQIALVSGSYEWLVCGAIMAVATIGKFGGSTFAARITGMTWRQGAAIGVLMNTRGLMELIVLNVGLELGVISQTLFTMMVLMALATTIATTPILRKMGT